MRAYITYACGHEACFFTKVSISRLSFEAARRPLKVNINSSSFRILHDTPLVCLGFVYKFNRNKYDGQNGRDNFSKKVLTGRKKMNIVCGSLYGNGQPTVEQAKQGLKKKYLFQIFELHWKEQVANIVLLPASDINSGFLMALC